MPENVQFQQVMVNGMVFKMGGNNIGGHIVGRMLDRGKGTDLFPHRKHHNASRMLSRGPADTNTALHNAVDLTIPFVNSPFFVIAFYIAKRLTLVITGKVQVNIRLFVSFKSEKRFKWNVEPVLD